VIHAKLPLNVAAEKSKEIKASKWWKYGIEKMKCNDKRVKILKAVKQRARVKPTIMK